jgi:Olfactomedin-like domain
MTGLTKIELIFIYEKIKTKISPQLGDMFVVCGILYGVDSTNRNTKIRFALDLYTSKLLEIEIPFTNPFNGTSSIGYNYNLKELYTWSAGNQLTYPVKINALGTNQTQEESMDELLKNSFGIHATAFRPNKNKDQN